MRHVGERATDSGTAAPWWTCRAVDRPVFWWSAGVVFLANAGLSAAEDRWSVALLQLLTAVWAFVAGVTAHERPSPGGSGGPRSAEPAGEPSAEAGHGRSPGERRVP